MRLILVLIGFVCTVASLPHNASTTSFLSVDKAGHFFSFGGQQVFLSGANQPWIDYGNDFGNNQPNGKICALQSYIANLTKAGGNSMRIWLFIEGDSIPSFNSTGFATATDKGNTLVSELRTYLQYAAAHNVFVHLCLWNGAVLRNPNAVALFTSPSKLDSFLSEVLSPMAMALAGEAGLASWEIINEPEGSLRLSDDSNPCYETSKTLAGTGAGWAGNSFTMQQLQVFINKQAAAIHRADPKALVTVGAWSEHSLTDAFSPYNGQGFRSYYKDECLVGAGGDKMGTLDFYQVHSYPAAVGPLGAPDHKPFVSAAGDYKLDKPLVIGEFAHKTCVHSGCTVSALYQWAYEHGYQGAWDWAINSWTSESVDGEVDTLPGLESIKAKPFVGVDIGGTPPPDTCSCSDVAPSSDYTCAQQAGWGKCGEDYMKGYCCRSCHACKGCAPPPTPPPPTPGCTDTPPDPGTYTCAQEKSWGKCDVKANPWMAGYCCRSCFNCDPKCGK